MPHRSGLGLSTARALVERAGGGVAVEANEPQGTRVAVTLPKPRIRCHRPLLLRRFHLRLHVY
ncbi:MULTISPECIES: ATP-binding protein [Gordonibacter]|uniref:ATP-binding protein n=1 Tax=Gordonibacter TaxID=644652 RepID=UPI00345E2EE3